MPIPEILKHWMHRMAALKPDLALPGPDPGSGMTTVKQRGFFNKGLRRYFARIIVPAAAVALLLSCAPVNLYNIDIQYIPSTDEETAEAGSVPLTVTLFNDQREREDTLLIGRVITPDDRIVPVLPRHMEPAPAVTRALTSYLTRSGHTVSSRHPEWDLREDTIDPSWKGLILGGAINDLFVECDRSTFLRTYSLRVNLTIVLADAEERRILHRVTVRTLPTKQHLKFSEFKLEEELNAALSEALERTFADSELTEKITGH